MHKIMDNYGYTANLIENNYSNLQTLTIGQNLALILKGGVSYKQKGRPTKAMGK